MLDTDYINLHGKKTTLEKMYELHYSKDRIDYRTRVGTISGLID